MFAPNSWQQQNNGQTTPPQVGRYRHRQTTNNTPLRSLDALLEDLDECVKYIDTPPSDNRVISLSPLSIRTTPSPGHSAPHYSPDRQEPQTIYSVVEGIRRGYRKSLWIDDGRRLSNKCPNMNNMLPGEVMLHIFSYLGVPDLALAAPTCRVWFVRMDPWVYLEHHGWVPLAPLSRCQNVHIRPSAADGLHLPSVFASCHKCEAITLELNGHSALLPDPTQHPDLIASWTTMACCRSAHVQRPTVEDMNLLRHLLCALPVLDTVTVSDLVVPMGVRVLYSVANTTATSLRLHKVGHLLGPALWRLFKLNPNLRTLVLYKCVLGAGNGTKIKVSCTLTRDGGVQRPITHSVKGPGIHSTFTDVSKAAPACVCLPCVLQSCSAHMLRPVAAPANHQQYQHHTFVHSPLPRNTPAAMALYA